MRLMFRRWLAESNRMSQEGAFLASALEDPYDPTALLVAADWLDEQGHYDLAEYIRTNIGLATGQPGPGRAAVLKRLNVIVQNALGHIPHPRFEDLFPTTVGNPPGKRKRGDEYRIVGGAVQSRRGRKPWAPHEGELPPEVARKLMGELSRMHGMPRHERQTEFYGDRTGRERAIRGQLEIANDRAYTLHVDARDGFHAPIRELRMSRVQFFQGWLDAADELVNFVEQIGRAGGKAPGEDARSLAYFGYMLQRLAGGNEAGLNDDALVARSQATWQRYEAAMRAMEAPRVVPAGAGEAW